MIKIDTKNFEQEFKEFFERHNVRAVCVYVSEHDPVTGKVTLSSMGDDSLDRLVTEAFNHYKYKRTN